MKSNTCTTKNQIHVVPLKLLRGCWNFLRWSLPLFGLHSQTTRLQGRNALEASLGEAATGADLGGSSKYGTPAQMLCV